MIAWIGGQRHRNAQARLFGETLQSILPPGNQRRGGNLPEVEMIHLQVRDLVYRRGDMARRVRLFLQRGIRVDRSPIDEQQAGFFLQGHLPQKVFHARFHRLARIFVKIQAAIFIEVAKDNAILSLKQRGVLRKKWIKRVCDRIGLHGSFSLPLL